MVRGPDTIEAIFMALYRPLSSEHSARWWRMDGKNVDSLVVGSLIEEALLVDKLTVWC